MRSVRNRLKCGDSMKGHDTGDSRSAIFAVKNDLVRISAHRVPRRNGRITRIFSLVSYLSHAAGNCR